MRTLTLLFTALVLVACQSVETPKEATADTTQPEQLAEEEVKPEDENDIAIEADFTECGNDIMIIENTDPHICKDYGDSMIYAYDKFTVKTVHHPEYNGNIIYITNHKYGNVFTIGEKESVFFMGFYQQYAIIDEGTSQVRTLYIYDIEKQALVYTDSYLSELILKDSMLYFYQQVYAENMDELPECPEELKELGDDVGYAGEIKYDFKQKGSAPTGVYKCQYFE